MKFHNNPFSPFCVHCEQLFAEPTETYIQTGILSRVFQFITLLETRSTKIWRDLDQCTDKLLNLIYIDSINNYNWGNLEFKYSLSLKLEILMWLREAISNCKFYHKKCEFYDLSLEWRLHLTNMSIIDENQEGQLTEK